jgi:hypothetical protein
VTADSTNKYGKVTQQRQEHFVSSAKPDATASGFFLPSPDLFLIYVKFATHRQTPT